MSQVVSFPGLGFELTVNRIAFYIGSIPIYWYGIIIATGLLLGLLFCYKKSETFGVTKDGFLDVVIWSIVGAVVCARLYYVIFSLDEFSSNWLDVFNIRTGGMAIYGGIIGGVVTAAIVSRVKKIKITPVLDIGGLGLLIGQGIGRWGNFVNQEAFGSNTTLPWGMTSPNVQEYLASKAGELSDIGIAVDPTTPVHPCFFYEFLWCALGFVLLWKYIDKRKFDGELFLMYVGWYGLGRFFIEGLRTDSLMLGFIRVSQLVGIVCFIAAIALILVIRGKIKRNAGDPDFMPLYVTTSESKAKIEAAAFKNDATNQSEELDDKTDADENSDEQVDEKKLSDDNILKSESDADSDDENSDSVKDGE